MGVSRARFARLSATLALFAPIVALIFIATQFPARAADSSLAARAQPVTTPSTTNRSLGTPIGKPLSIVIVFGNQYVDGDELYDAKITVVKILRGAPAESLVRSASASNPPPPNGFEYLAARIRFEFSARVVPEHYSYPLDPGQFSSISADGKPFPAPALVAQPKPNLRATLHSGDSAEGWVVLLVPRDDRTPLMLFVPNTGSTYHEGSGSVFRLFVSADRAVLGSGAKSS